jgi:hypothetical protein
MRDRTVVGGVVTTCGVFLLMGTLFALASTGAVTNTTFTPIAFSCPPYVAEDGPLTPTTLTCAGLQMLIPLYSYPTWYSPTTYIWDDVLTATSQISITAIINPNNGPGGCPPNIDYQRGITDLRDGGVTILGYVDTGYGARPSISVTNDISLYNQCFDIDGIFFDRVTNTVPFSPTEKLCKYVKSLSPTFQVFLNPGTPINVCYIITACDTVVIFEDYSSKLPDQCPVGCADCGAEQCAMLVHTVPDTDTMKSHINWAVACNIGYVYATDDTMDNPYDRLPVFWQAEVDYIAWLNMCYLWLPLILRNY